VPALPERQLSKGIVSHGETSRLRRVLAKLMRGEAATVVAVGGSITWQARSQLAGSPCSCILPAAIDPKGFHLPGARCRLQPASKRSLLLPLCRGQGSSKRGELDWASRLFTWLRGTFPHSNLTLLNAAVPGTPSSYM
jgi:hypothetical protein